MTSIGHAKFEDAVVISGIGQSEVGRRLDRSPLALTLDAITAALDDAGVDADDVGGIATYPGGGTSLGAGFAGPDLAEVMDALALDLDFMLGNFEGPAQIGPVLTGAMAIATRAARHVVVYRTVTEGSGRAEARARGVWGGPSDWSRRWITPFGGGPAPIGPALLARRHFHEHGTTREQLAQIALTDRRHAALNPKAVYRDPMTMDDYLSARMVSEPLCLYDCDVYCDASTAFVLSHADFAEDAHGQVVHLEAMGHAPSRRTEYTDQVELAPGRWAAEQMWGRTELTPADVDVAGVYDGFSILTMMWLEALRFCGRGESGPFVEGGERITLGGELPINTNGGQLSGGRLHGFGFVHEVCLQLRGEATGRQVEHARVGAVAVGAMPHVGCLLLRTDA